MFLLFLGIQAASVGSREKTIGRCNLVASTEVKNLRRLSLFLAHSPFFFYLSIEPIDMITRVYVIGEIGMIKGELGPLCNHSPYVLREKKYNNFLY